MFIPGACVEEDVDGQAFLDLKEEEVKGLFPKLGHVKKVLRLQCLVTNFTLLESGIIFQVFLCIAEVPRYAPIDSCQSCIYHTFTCTQPAYSTTH